MSRRPTDPSRRRLDVPISGLCLYGIGAGIMGVAAYVHNHGARVIRCANMKSSMTVSEKIEQYFTSRPNSLVPGRTLEKLLGLAARSDSQMWSINMAMHYGQGVVAGIARAVMSVQGIRGPFADFMFMGVRLLIDQTLENWTGVGAPPW